ncbi:MAG TPA: hypothetical protein VGO69_04580 [Pyrinomonadaceae bacterium]|nr:hypothetical protein [Pyrinomonadaceae bacterium]
MPVAPKKNREKLDSIVNTWQTLAPSKSFAGMTLAQFKSAIQPSYDTREQIRALEEQLNAKHAERDKVDEASMRTAQLIVNAVIADTTEGPDSPLYEGFGYKRKSERKTGLTRKKKPVPAKETQGT